MIALRAIPQVMRFGLLVLLFVMAAHYWLLDGLPGWFLAEFGGDDAEYAPGYTESGFRRVGVGMSPDGVRGILGSPLWEMWIYSGPSQMILFNGERVERVLAGDDARLKAVTPETSMSALRDLRAVATEVRWGYTRNPKDGSYRVRLVVFRGNEVHSKEHEFYVD